MSTEQAESVVKEMLQKEGAKNLVVVLTGLMEAGKTTLLHRLFGKDLPDRYNSTGIAERSLRGLTQYLCSADKELRLVENPQDMFELVAKVKMVPSVRIIDSEVSSTNKDEEHNAKAKANTVDQITDSKEGDGTIFIHSTAKEIKSETVAMTHMSVSEVQKKPSSIREMVKIVCQNPDTCYSELELVHIMIDTGGQPESLEVLPSLIHNEDLVLLVVNLKYCLEEPTTPTFHEHGRKFTKKIY